jgi:hypothetical protein
MSDPFQRKITPTINIGIDNISRPSGIITGRNNSSCLYS